MLLDDHRLVRLAYKPYLFSQRTIFFSHNKSANSSFSHGLSAKRTGHIWFESGLWTPTRKRYFCKLENNCFIAQTSFCKIKRVLSYIISVVWWWELTWDSSEASKIQMGPHTFGSASMVEWATKRRWSCNCLHPEIARGWSGPWVLVSLNLGRMLVPRVLRCYTVLSPRRRYKALLIKIQNKEYKIRCTIAP